MNREIKFRAWDGESMRQVYQMAFKKSGVLALRDDQLNEITGPGPMQFTGLNDCNGVEIYEGDIVNFTYWWFDGDERESNLSGEIIYEPVRMSFALKGIKNEEWLRHVAGDQGESDTSPFAFFNFDEADFEVIGNIYENPELLEASHDTT